MIVKYQINNQSEKRVEYKKVEKARRNLSLFTEDPLQSYLNGQSFVNFENFRVNLLQLSLPPTFLSV